MTIKEFYNQAEEDTKRYWRGCLLGNYSQLYAWIVFSLLETQRPRIVMGDVVSDDGEPKEKINYFDFYTFTQSLSPSFRMHRLKLDEFIGWFMELDVEKYYKEDDEIFVNWLSFEFMAEAWNDFAGGRQ